MSGGELHRIPMPAVLYSSILLTCVVLSSCISTDNPTVVTSQTMQSFFDSEIVSKYSKYIRPVNNLEDKVDVRASLTLHSITELDCVFGVFHTIGHLEIKWTDRLLSWKNYSESFKNIKSIRMRTSDVWIPPVVVTNPFEDTGEINTGSGVIIINESGEMIWKPMIMTKSLCTTNVQYFPFDVQTCNVSFGIVGYKPSEVKLVTTKGEENIDISSLNTNTEWNVDQSKVYNTVSQHSSIIHFEIKMSRKPVYFVINLLLPVLLITVLITCSFMIPAEEGRGQPVSIGFITLSFYFIHTISFLPKASDTMTYLGYFFMWQMIYSVLVSASAILSVFLYFKTNNDNIPKFLHILISGIIRKPQRKEKCTHITRITVVPPDTKRRNSASVIIDPQRSPCCPDNENSKIRYMYPEINRQVSVQSQTSIEEPRQSDVGVERQISCIGRQTSESSDSSSSSKAKRVRKVSPVLNKDDKVLNILEGQQGENTGKIPNINVRRSSQKGVHWRKQNFSNENEAKGSTSVKQRRTSSIRSRGKSQLRIKHEQTSVVISDITKDTNGLSKTQGPAQLRKTKQNAQDLNRKPQESSGTQLTWKQVSLTLDKIFLLSYLVINVVISTFFLFPLAARL